MISLRLFSKSYDCPTYAAILLFGRDPKCFLPGAYVQYVRWGGLDNASEILNQREFCGNLCTMLPQIDTFIDMAVVQKRPVPVSALREEIFCNYPKWSLRELLMNAIMHRDYKGHAPIKFYQYPDRIEIVNHGGLYGKARPENFPMVNDYRNPAVAEGMKILGYVNMFNHGIAKVQRELATNGNGKAVFTVDRITVFEAKVKETEGWSSPVNDPVNDPVNNPVNNPVNDPVNDHQTANDASGLDDELKRLLAIIAIKPNITYEEMASSLNKSRATIRRYIKELKADGIIRREGADKSGRWLILASRGRGDQ